MLIEDVLAHELDVLIEEYEEQLLLLLVPLDTQLELSEETLLVLVLAEEVLIEDVLAQELDVLIELQELDVSETSSSTVGVLRITPSYRRSYCLAPPTRTPSNSRSL